jgi:hypothetical protein
MADSFSLVTDVWSCKYTVLYPWHDPFIH